METCDLTPTKLCKNISQMVAALAPLSRCAEFPRRICSFGLADERLSEKPLVTKWCYHDSDIEATKLVSPTTKHLLTNHEPEAGGQNVRNTGGQPLRKTGGQPLRKTGGQPIRKTGGEHVKKTGGPPLRKTGGQPLGKTGGQPIRKTGGEPVRLARVRVSQFSRSYLPPVRETERRGRQIEKLPGLN